MKFSCKDEITTQQLHDLGYLDQSQRHDRPLLICDVDEVVLHLVDPFKNVLEERGYILRSDSFKLTGNIFDKETGREATQEEVWAGLTQLFEEQYDRQSIVNGVVEALNNLSEQADIVFLTNMPHEFGAIRRDYLAENNLTFPLITNSGSKVPAMHAMQMQCDTSVGFIDDTPRNLQQVNDALPDVHLFHFMANESFRQLAGDIDGVNFSAGNWPETETHIRSVLLEIEPSA